MQLGPFDHSKVRYFQPNSTDHMHRRQVLLTVITLVGSLTSTLVSTHYY